MNTKSIILLLLTIGVFTLAKAQPSSEYDQTLSVLPPSPNSSSLTKFVDFPIGYNTGTVSVSVPLAEAIGRGIKVPLTVNYHTAGIKVNDVSSEIGLGWSLSTGSFVTRTVVGSADERADGFINRGNDIPAPDDISYSSTLDNFTSGNWDGQPDIFTFKAGKYSGKFVISPDNDIVVSPHQDVKIDYNLCGNCSYPLNGAIVDIIITTPDGIKYTFGSEDGVEYTTSSSYNINGGNGSCNVKSYNIPEVTTWNIKSIYNPSTDDTISFEYESNLTRYDLSVNESYTLPSSILLNNCTNNITEKHCITRLSQNGTLLTSITSSNGTILLNNISQRQDVETISGNSRCDEVLILGKTGGLLKKIKLNQSFVHSSGSTPSTHSFSSYRMYLDKVQFFSSNDELINETAFNYINRSGMPPRLSYSQDYWGFYNAKSNSQLTPVTAGYDTYLPMITNAFPNFNAADRTVNELTSKYALLDEVIYPTGGKVSYEYETNQLAHCDDVTYTNTLSSTTSALYNSGPYTSSETFSLDYSQTVSIQYDVLMVGFRENGAEVRIINTANNQVVYTKGGASEFNSPIHITGTDDIQLGPGNYVLEAEVKQDADPPFSPDPEFASITITYTEQVTENIENENIGGLRVKKVVYSDEDGTTTNDIVKRIKYNKDVNGCNRSTGVFLAQTPKYFASKITGYATGSCDFELCHWVYISSSSLSSIVNGGGNIMEYEEVWELEGDNAQNGKTYYKYHISTDSPSHYRVGESPNGHFFTNSPTTDRSYFNGRILEKKIYDSANNLVQEEFNTYEFSDSTHYAAVKGMFATRLYEIEGCTFYETICDGDNNLGDEYWFSSSCIPVFDQNGSLSYDHCDTIYGLCYDQPAGTFVIHSSTLDSYHMEWYDFTTQWIYLKQNKQRIYDSNGSGNYVETIKNYSYDALGRHTQPVGESIVNSDGNLHFTEYKYPPQLSDNLSVNMSSNWNMKHVPIETAKKVNNVEVENSKNIYSYFNNQGNPTTSITSNRPPLMKAIDQKSITFDQGTLIDEGWYTALNIHSYDSNCWKPKVINKYGWENEEFTWTDGLLTKKEYQDFEWSYSYYPNSRQLERMIDIDGQIVNYTYDNFQRLLTQSERGGKVIKTFSYNYDHASADQNYVKTTTDYAYASRSSYRKDIKIKYFDGLGRVVQEVDQKQNFSNQKDIVHATVYDAFDRVSKKFENVASPYSDGRKIAVNLSQPHQTNQYYPSPLDRIYRTTEKGWNPTFDYTEYNYLINTSYELSYPNFGYFPANSLLKTVITNPDGNKNITYSDKLSRTLAQRETNNQESSSYMSTTFFLYDYKNRVATVIPPEASLYKPDMLYKYQYDGKNRIIKKTVPGAEEVYLKYDDRGLLRLEQSGTLRNISTGRWFLHEYDDYGREIKNGFYNGSSNPNPSSNLAFSEVLLETCYDGSLCSGATSTNPIYKGKIREVKSKILDNSNTWLNKKYYYDSYGRVSYIYGNNHLNSSSYSNLYERFYYDYADNTTYHQFRHKDASGINRYVYNWYYYSHNGDRREVRHRYGTSGSSTRIGKYTYDHRGLMETKVLGPDLQQVNYTYNNKDYLQRINSSSLGGGSLPLPTGCNLPLPNPTNSSNYNANDLFYLELYYDNTMPGILGLEKKNGSISQVAWRVRGRERQVYNYFYDYRDMLKSAQYYDLKDNGTFVLDLKYNTSYNYNSLGNITSLTRKGMFKNSSGCNMYGTIDDLTYTYYPNTVRIKSVSDASPSSSMTEGFTSGQSQAFYMYDENGNVTLDPSKDITIEYNHLNLPTVIEENGSLKSVEITYDANGNKLKQVYKNGSTVITEQDYVSNIEYRNGNIESIYNEEGRLYNVNVGSSGSIDFRYEYNLKDHLGSTRIVFTDKNNDNIIQQTSDPSTSEVIQENHFYPFGMEMKGPWLDDLSHDNPYQYTGKEKIEEMGLDLYDYGARYYNPTLGVFMSTDPLSDKFPSHSPYNYTLNNPLRFTDPDGRAALDVIGGGPGDPIKRLKRRVADLFNNIFGTNIPVTGEPRSSRVRHGRFSLAIEGNLKAGPGVGVKGSIMGVKGKVSADAGSFRVAEGRLGSDESSISIMNAKNHKLERDLSIYGNITDNLQLGAGVEQVETTSNGNVASNEVGWLLGLKTGDVNYGLGSKTDQKSDVKSRSISIGFGGQLIIGGEAKLKLELKTSSNKDDLYRKNE